jgi:hypothetical protein
MHPYHRHQVTITIKQVTAVRRRAEQSRAEPWRALVVPTSFPAVAAVCSSLYPLSLWRPWVPRARGRGSRDVRRGRRSRLAVASPILNIAETVSLRGDSFASTASVRVCRVTALKPGQWLLRKVNKVQCDSQMLARNDALNHCCSLCGWSLAPSPATSALL